MEDKINLTSFYARYYFLKFTISGIALFLVYVLVREVISLNGDLGILHPAVNLVDTDVDRLHP